MKNLLHQRRRSSMLMKDLSVGDGHQRGVALVRRTAVWHAVYTPRRRTVGVVPRAMHKLCAARRSRARVPRKISHFHKNVKFSRLWRANCAL